ncbi:MAG: hypothetical protein ACRD0H_08925, partial [Actinomycetes bacterium]
MVVGAIGVVAGLFAVLVSIALFVLGAMPEVPQLGLLGGAVLAAAGAVPVAVRGARLRVHHRRQREEGAQHRVHDAWVVRYQVRSGHLGDGPVRAQADRLVAAVAAVEGSRAFREGAIGQEGRVGLRAPPWSLLCRLRDSIGDRADLAAAEELARGEAGVPPETQRGEPGLRRAELARAAVRRRDEIADLDAEAAGMLESLVA